MEAKDGQYSNAKAPVNSEKPAEVQDNMNMQVDPMAQVMELLQQVLVQ